MQLLRTGDLLEKPTRLCLATTTATALPPLLARWRPCYRRLSRDLRKRSRIASLKIKTTLSNSTLLKLERCGAVRRAGGAAFGAPAGAGVEAWQAGGGGGAAVPVRGGRPDEVRSGARGRF
eukprot:793802-Prorocentrum_minimum.AAC.2